MTFQYPMRPCNATVLPKTPEYFWIQPKYDGWNVVITNGKIYTRRGKDITNWNCWAPIDLYPQFPLNGELVTTSKKREDIPRIKREKVNYKIVIFDAMIELRTIEERFLYLYNTNLGKKEYIEVCQTLNGEDFIEGGWSSINTLFRLFSLEKEIEGLVLKRKNSPYFAGEHASIHSPDWIKVKTQISL